MGFGVAKDLKAHNHQKIQVPNLELLLPQKAVLGDGDSLTSAEDFGCVGIKRPSLREMLSGNCAGLEGLVEREKDQLKLRKKGRYK